MLALFVFINYTNKEKGKRIRDMKSEGNYVINSCGIYDCDADWCWSTKGFKDYDLWAVLRGDGQLTLDDTPYRVTGSTCAAASS